MKDRPDPRDRRLGGFTLVELLVVVGIIALLIGILLPSLSRARESAKQIQCMNNLRQFGIGFAIYEAANKGTLPSEGYSDGTGPGNKSIGVWADPGNWWNAIPQAVGLKPYSTLQTSTQLYSLPGPGSNSVWCCPDADAAGSAAGSGDPPITADGFFQLYGAPDSAITAAPPANSPPVAPAELRKVYWCYVYNSKLNNTIGHDVVVRVSQVRDTTVVPILVEKLMRPIPDPSYAATKDSLARGKTAVSRFATRHRGGGCLLFLDGHVAWFSRHDLYYNPPNTAAQDWNYPGKVVWNPWGPTNGD